MEIIIRLDPNGQMAFQCKGGNVPLAIFALEKAKMELLTKQPEPQTIEPAPASLLSRLNGAR